MVFWQYGFHHDVQKCSLCYNLEFPEIFSTLINGQSTYRRGAISLFVNINPHPLYVCVYTMDADLYTLCQYAYYNKLLKGDLFVVDLKLRGYASILPSKIIYLSGQST